MLTPDQKQKLKSAGYSDAKITAFEAQRAAKIEEQSPSKPDYLQRVGTQFKNAASRVITGVEQGAEAITQGLTRENGVSPEQKALDLAKGVGRTALRTAGTVASTAFAPITEAPGVKDVTEAVVKTAAQIPGVDSLIAKGSELAKKYPNASKDIEDFINLATLGGGTVAEQGAKKLAVGGANLAEGGVNTARDALGGIIESGGRKIQNTVIKPSARDMKDGFKIENVSKYDVGGSLPETIAKSHVKMNELSQQLKTALEGSNVKLNMQDVFMETKNRLLKDKTKIFGDNRATDRVLKSLADEIKAVTGGKRGLDLVEATNVKRGAGAKGSWAYNRPEADSSAIEKVYTEFYDVLKNKIEQTAPEGVKEINKKISELIPINNAALRRLTVEERNSALSLMDTIGLTSAIFDPRALLLLGTNRALKSGRFGKGLVDLGKKIKAN